MIRSAWLRKAPLMAILAPLVLLSAGQESLTCNDTGDTTLTVFRLEAPPGQNRIVRFDAALLTYDVWLPSGAGTAVLRGESTDPGSELSYNLRGSSGFVEGGFLGVHEGEVTFDVTTGANKVSLYVKAPGGASDSYTVRINPPCPERELCWSGGVRGTCSDDVCIAGSSGDPYAHVTPSDVGVSIGVGVIAPVPTALYMGPKSPAAGTTIENVIIDHELEITSPDVTIRNVILNSSQFWPILIEGVNATDVVVEYSQVNCLSSGKLFQIQDARRAIIRNNEGTGCQDFFFIDGPLESLLVENNYFHTLIGDASAHADGFQIGEFEVTTGQITIRGNYFEVDNDQIGRTDLLYSTKRSRAEILMENNFFSRWGWYTLRNGGEYSTCTIRNNIYSDEFIPLLPINDESPIFAYRHAPDNPAPSGGYSCNRYQNGRFIEQHYVSGDTHLITGCPSYLPPP